MIIWVDLHVESKCTNSALPNQEIGREIERIPDQKKQVATDEDISTSF
jgi:hypothetical protein